MATETGVLPKPITSGDVADAVTEQTAEIADLLLEGRRRRIGIVFGFEHQRMPALRAHVFVAAVAIGELLVIVLAEKTRQRVTNPGDRAVLGQVPGAAAAPAPVAGGLLEDVVVDVVAPQET